MPNVTYNAQSFAIDARRFWILGASMQYVRIPSELWADRIAAAKQAGFNTIETACPWMVHEPRSGKFNFDGDADLRRFVKLCDEAGLKVILRIGPYVDAGFDGGGLPGWLIEMPEVKLREANAVFLEHASRYLNKLTKEISDLQVTKKGPILLLQCEHSWTCSNELQAARYLQEITRFIRESGIDVPLINANDLWMEMKETVDTWRGYDDLLSHLRQLRTLQPSAPQFVSAFDPTNTAVWELESRGKAGRESRSSSTGEKTPEEVMKRLGEVLASGAQVVVSPFHAGTNFEFYGGRVSGRADGFLATSPHPNAPLGEAGRRGSAYHAVRRLITFANHFSHVFAELDSDYHPIVLDPEGDIDAESSGKSKAKSKTSHISVMPVRSLLGRIIFVFAQTPNSTANLVLENGLRLPVNLGDQLVGWYGLDLDLHGSGRLDYANVCPWAIVDRSIVVFHGPANSTALLSVDSTPYEATIPAKGSKPLLIEHKGLTIVICNQRQIDTMYHNQKEVFIGVEALDDSDQPVLADGKAKAWVIRSGGKLELYVPGEPENETDKAATTVRRVAKSTAQTIRLNPWAASPRQDHVNGISPRFASLDGPETLNKCGAPVGYGWYRFKVNATRKRLCHIPSMADRVHVYIDGKLKKVFGVGPGADRPPIELKVPAADQTVVALVDNLGRFSEGNDLNDRKGIWSPFYHVKPMRSIKPKVEVAEPVDPFALRGFIAERPKGQMSSMRQAVWNFVHRRNTPILIDVNGAMSSGTFVLNDSPINYYAGATGGGFDRIVLQPALLEAFRKGKNVLRFAPDAGQDEAAAEVSKATDLYECVEEISDAKSWSFAKWEPPRTLEYSPASGAEAAKLKGAPCWWRTTFELDESVFARNIPVWLEPKSLSKGQVFINGRNLGRYFSSTATGRSVGPQTRLYIPPPWLHEDKENELVIFDEHGFQPSRVRVIASPEK